MANRQTGCTCCAKFAKVFSLVSLRHTATQLDRPFLQLQLPVVQYPPETSRLYRLLRLRGARSTAAAPSSSGFAAPTTQVAAAGRARPPPRVPTAHGNRPTRLR